MELGEKLKQARLEAGVSQRQLCGEVITRNMLSRIENGFARPSMDTLRQFAQRLGKPISYFLEEEILRQANAEAAAILDKASADIALEKKKALNEAKDEISDLALAIAGKVVGRELENADHEALISGFIDQLGE